MGRPATIRLVLAAAAAVAGARVASPASAQDAPAASKKVDLSVAMRWDAGETVTIAGAFRTRTESAARLDPSKPRKVSTSERKVDCEFVVRCDEAGPEGRFLRGRAFVRKWRCEETGSAADTSVQGAHVDLADGRSAVVPGTAKPSSSADVWLVQAFDGGVPARSSLWKCLRDVAPLGVGEHADVGGSGDPAIKGGTSKVRLVSATRTPDGTLVVLAREGSATITGGGRRTEIALKGRATGVVERWQRGAEESSEMTARTTMQMPGVEATSDARQTETLRWTRGGTIPPRPGDTPPAPPK